MPIRASRQKGDSDTDSESLTSRVNKIFWIVAPDLQMCEGPNLRDTARTKVALYCDAYANRSGTTYAFLQCAMFTWG